MKTLFAIALAGAAIAAPAAAQIAQPEPRTIAVSTEGLDLTDPADAAVLDRRIRAAVREVCGSAPSFDPEGRNQVRECRELTMESLSAPRDAFAAR